METIILNKNETLPELFKRYGIDTMKELSLKTGKMYQQIWNFWTGYTPLGSRQARDISGKLGIPYIEIVAASLNSRARLTKI